MMYWCQSATCCTFKDTCRLPLYLSKHVEETLDLHSATYNQTVEAGRQLCAFMTESQCQSRLQGELQAMEEAWEESTALLRKRQTLLSAITQVTSIFSPEPHSTHPLLRKKHFRLE